MRNLRLLDMYRRTDKEIIDYFGSTGDETCGFFIVPSPIDKGDIKVMASSGEGWDHLSVSRSNRCPRIRNPPQNLRTASARSLGRSSRRSSMTSSSRSSMTC